MLRKRVITAIVLLLILMVSLWIGVPWFFLGLLAVVCGCAAWEWLRLTLAPAQDILARSVGVVLFFVCLAMIYAWTWLDDSFDREAIVWWIDVFICSVAFLWIVGAIQALLPGRTEGPFEKIGWSIFGVAALLAAWIALAVMYFTFSAWFVISLLITVWIADIMAYFVGQTLGKRKLAPYVSPEKTVVGALAGVVSSVAWLIGSGLLWDHTFGAILIQYFTVFGAIVSATLIGAISIIGDLIESLLKRRAGRKDSSNLLPGHGGVIDRIDAILPVAVCAHAMLFIGARMELA